jgi:hypothetical protein
MSNFEDRGQKNVIVRTVETTVEYVYWDVRNIVLYMCIILATIGRLQKDNVKSIRVC